MTPNERRIILWDSMYYVRYTPQEVRVLVDFARRAELGGKSQFRPGPDRAERMQEDQRVGQFCELALSMWRWGSDEGMTRYRNRRRRLTMGKGGDGGSDLDGYRIDVKGSKRWGLLYEHHLVVRPAEAHAEYYVLGVASDTDAYLLGWLSRGELPDKTESTGWARGAYMVEADDLRPMSELRKGIEDGNAVTDELRIPDHHGREVAAQPA